ncbi:MAG TPA: RHS repeat-associated core domain-containing protein, partial [Bacteroidales bacterium]
MGQKYMHTAPHTAMPAMQPRFDCGHTGHEMLCGFGLINMNGRLYDPGLQRFLSPDNVVQAPDNGQNYNRYSYCLNNPLRYTYPSGWESQPVITLPGGLSFYTLEDYHAYLRSLDHETPAFAG